MTTATWLLAAVAAGEFALLILGFRLLDKVETEAIRHFRNSLRDSGRACAAESKVRALEAERDRGKWHGGPPRG